MLNVWKVLGINKQQEQMPASRLTCKLQFGLFYIFAHVATRNSQD